MTGDKVVTDVRTDAVDELLGGVSDDDASDYQSRVFTENITKCIVLTCMWLVREKH